MENRLFDDCMLRVVQGDKEALHMIYEAYAGSLFHFILGIVGSYQDAEDLTSELFLKLWKQADSYKPGNGHRQWLHTLARNLAVDHLRAHQREIPNDPETMAQTLTETAEEPAKEVLGNLSVKQALDTLNPSEREVIHLKIVAGLTFSQIAAMLEIPMGTITWRYRQGINRLRRCGYEA